MGTEHTPGPWHSEGCFIKAKTEAGALQLGSTLPVNYRYGPDGLEVSDVLPQYENAKLMAAAPVLAEACEALVEWDSRPDEEQTDERLLAIIEEGRAALRKAGVLE